VTAVRIPRLLATGVREDNLPDRHAWLARLPALIADIAAGWELELGEAFEPGGYCAWVAPARTAAGDDVVLKVAWDHWEADHEAEGLRAWDGQGAIRCLRSGVREDAAVLLLERCRPGRQLGATLPEPEQDVIIAGVLHRLWEAQPHPGAPFRPLTFMCERWAASFERRFAADARGLDPGMARAGLAALREPPAAGGREVLLCTDLHAGNVLAAQREPWLAIDPKPFVGDPAYDTVQHMLNCDARLASDPAALARRMAGLLDLEPDRVMHWLFARCAQEALDDSSMREPARRLASALP
jgi:streptomycin 6-kinase